MIQVCCAFCFQWIRQGETYHETKKSIVWLVIVVVAVVTAGIGGTIFLLGIEGEGEASIVERLSHTEVGDRVSFGDYKGYTDWLVVAIEDDRTLLISEKCVDERQFHNTAENVSWEQSDLKSWLNDDYYKSAFSRVEKGLIASDGVFVLSAEEVTEYFYIYLSNSISCIVRDEAGEKLEWWLRPVADEVIRCIESYGYISEYQVDATKELGVRPAVWVTIPREENSYIKGAKLHYIRHSDFCEPADDRFDYQWKIDYQVDEDESYIYVNDSKQYENIFGFSKPTEQELCDAIDANPQLNYKYRAFFKGFIKDWLAMYPDSDLSVLKYNLATLGIMELQEGAQAFLGGAIASYMPGNNCIYIAADAAIEDKASEDYVTAVHETIHVARNAIIEKDDGTVIFVSFNDFPSNTREFGNYQDEAIVSHLAYSLQNKGNKSMSYVYLSSMYRQFMPYIDYGGLDYINHSAGCFIEKLQDYFDECGIRYNALSIFRLMDSLMITHSSDGWVTEISDYSALYETLSRLRQHQIGYEEMTDEERQAAFDEFWADLTMFVDPETSSFTDITKDAYRPYWE